MKLHTFEAYLAAVILLCVYDLAAERGGSVPFDSSRANSVRTAIYFYEQENSDVK
jgi:hypothetical protein